LIVLLIIIYLNPLVPSSIVYGLTVLGLYRKSRYF
jgi:hypothetical protein